MPHLAEKKSRLGQVDAESGAAPEGRHWGIWPEPWGEDRARAWTKYRCSGERNAGVADHPEHGLLAEATLVFVRDLADQPHQPRHPVAPESPAAWSAPLPPLRPSRSIGPGRQGRLGRLGTWGSPCLRERSPMPRHPRSPRIAHFDPCTTRTSQRGLSPPDRRACRSPSRLQMLLQPTSDKRASPVSHLARQCDYGACRASMSRNSDVDAKARGSRGSTLNSPLIPRPASGILRCFLNLFINRKGLCHLGRGRISWVHPPKARRCRFRFIEVANAAPASYPVRRGRSSIGRATGF